MDNQKENTQQKGEELPDKAKAKITGDKDKIPPVANLATDSIQRTAKQEPALNEAATENNDLEPGTRNSD
jgi:hypothetical protein